VFALIFGDERILGREGKKKSRNCGGKHVLSRGITMWAVNEGEEGA